MISFKSIHVHVIMDVNYRQELEIVILKPSAKKFSSASKFRNQMMISLETLVQR